MEVLRLPDVSRKLGLGQSTIRRLSVKDPSFPKPFKLMDKVTVWDKAELDQWLLTKKQGARNVTE